uniref:Nuclear receptor 2C2-associated protein n=1 Tax=Calidris pygmaea TaxID=425635 RepID=A0A8C3PLR3_9CHAR
MLPGCPQCCLGVPNDGQGSPVLSGGPQWCSGGLQYCQGVPSAFWGSPILPGCPQSCLGVPNGGQGSPIVVRGPQCCPGVPTVAGGPHFHPPLTPSLRRQRCPWSPWSAPTRPRGESCPPPPHPPGGDSSGVLRPPPHGGSLLGATHCPVADAVSPHHVPLPGVVARVPGRVSSVLNRDVKQFGKKHMFDASEETCWNSDQGTCQWVTLDFPRTVKVSQLHIQFQGGFSSRLCTLEGCRAGEEPVRVSELYPEDTNAMQRFQVEETVLDKLKITFENSTDFFGRIVVYHLGVLGEKL